MYTERPDLMNSETARKLSYATHLFGENHSICLEGLQLKLFPRLEIIDLLAVGTKESLFSAIFSG